MKKTHIIILCIIIAICVTVNVYCDLGQDQRGLDYRISLIEVVNLYVTSPILWGCVGVLVGSLIGVGEGIPSKLRRWLITIASISAVVYVCAIILVALKVNMDTAYSFVAWCISHASIFTVPGFICGISIKK